MPSVYFEGVAQQVLENNGIDDPTDEMVRAVASMIRRVQSGSGDLSTPTQYLRDRLDERQILASEDEQDEVVSAIVHEVRSRWGRA